MYIVSYTDPLFVIKNINQYILSIWFSPDGLSFFIYSPENKKVLIIREQKLDAFNVHQTQAELEKIIEKEPLLNYNYLKTKIYIETKSISIYPESFFDLENAEKNFSQLIKVKRSDQIINCFKQELHIYFSFKLHKATQEYFEAQFADSSLNSSWEVYFKLALEWIKHNQNNKTLFVKLKEKELFLLAFVGEEPILANSFTTKNELDNAYFILNSFNNLSFDPLKNPIVIYGNSSYKESVIKHLQKFIKNIKHVNLNIPAISNSYSLDYPINQYIEKFYSCICE